MAQKKYSEKLKDPRWQRNRLKILDRDKWTCQGCGDKKSTLFVHHLYYEKDKDPWEYPPEAFLTLCESCHEEEYEYLPHYEKSLLDALKKKGFLADDIISIAHGFYYIALSPLEEKRLSCAIGWLLESEEMLEELLKTYQKAIKEAK